MPRVIFFNQVGPFYVATSGPLLHVHSHQIYAALIVYLLLCYTKFLCNLNVALQHFMRILQLNLFRTCSLPELFEPLGQLPNNMCIHNQLTLALA